MPPRWPSNSRDVIGHSFSGKAGQYFWTGASRSSLPRSQSCKTAVAVMGLEMDPSRKSVEEVTGAKSSRSAMPKPVLQTGSPSNTTATPIPGTLFSDMKLETAFSICARFSLDRICCSAETAGQHASNKPSRQKRGKRKQFILAAIRGEFTRPPPARESTPKRGMPGTALREAPRVLRASPPPENVDLAVSLSLPWRDDPTARHDRLYVLVRDGSSRLRGRGEKARAGTSTGASSRTSSHAASGGGTCAL